MFKIPAEAETEQSEFAESNPCRNYNVDSRLRGNENCNGNASYPFPASKALNIHFKIII